jgi:hypothetical protein
MNRLYEISDCGFVTSIPDWKIARLLGLSLPEYHDLSHRGLKELTDIFGEVIEYYIHISQNNKTEILNKLDRDRYGYVRFGPDQVRHVLTL